MKNIVSLTKYACRTSIGFAFTILICTTGIEGVRADAYLGYGGVVTEPNTDRSFVRTSSPGRSIVAADFQYVSDVQSNVTAGSVDVIMQQCFGGGFIGEFASSSISNLTVSSATRYNEVAYNQDNVGAYFNISKYLNNFTHPYYDAMRTRSSNGVYDWFLQAGGGDPYTTTQMGAVIGKEHPNYFTRDSVTDTAAGIGTNNTRTFQHNAAVGASEQYAILVSWDDPDPRHAVNIARMFDSLVDDFGVPEANIVVLHGNSVFGSQIGNWGAVDWNITNDPFIDGINNRTNWINALKGDLFAPGTKAGANIPDANDKLLIYNTGHGSHALLRTDGLFRPVNTASNKLETGSMDLVTDGVGFGYAPQTEEASSIMDDPLGDGDMMVQLLLRDEINTDAVFNIIGLGATSAGVSLVTDPDDVLEYNGLLLDELFYAYQFRVDYTALQSIAGSFEFEIDNLDTLYVRDDLVAALSFIGGDQETAYLDASAASVVPLPASAWLFLSGLAVLIMKAITIKGIKGVRAL